MKKIVFVGAGSVVFTQGLLADLIAFPELRGMRIALHDIDAGRLQVAEAVARRITGGAATVTAHLDRREALDGADFVINMVQVGGYDATVTDFEIPARYGLRQTIADTIGAGGVFRALRTFPLLDALAADIAAVCPDALLLNYTNPMAMNVWYLSGKVKNVVGLCHSVYWTMRGLADLVSVPYEEVSYVAAGVNHQAWVLRFERDGEDLYPRLDVDDPELRRRVRIDMYRRLGYYPTETSEHSAEYVPWLMHHDSEIDRLRIPVGEYLRVSEENRVDAVFAVPVMLQRVLELPAADLDRAWRTHRPRIVAVSGSALPGDLSTRFMDRFGEVLYNLYGSTEVSWVSIAGPRDLRTAPGTAGRAPVGTSLVILGDDGRPVPPGTEGRVFVHNDMPFAGYTREGVDVERHGRLIGTGDVGRLDEHGLLHLTGRADDMIVSGGENVHPGPVEDLIAARPEVREAAVTGVPDEQYGQRLAAYVVLEPGAEVTADDVRGWVRAELSRFSVPRDVEFVDELPRNATGKVVHRELGRDRSHPSELGKA